MNHLPRDQRLTVLLRPEISLFNSRTMAINEATETFDVEIMSDLDSSEKQTSMATFQTGDDDQENNRKWKAVHDRLSDALETLDQIEIRNDSDREAKEEIGIIFGDTLEALYKKVPFLAEVQTEETMGDFGSA